MGHGTDVRLGGRVRWVLLRCDYVGPTVAAAVGAAWATHGIAGATSRSTPAGRASQVGAAHTIDAADEAGAAAQHVLTTGGHRQAALRVMRQIEALPVQAEVFAQLLQRTEAAAA